jgi:hypothetical protein
MAHLISFETAKFDIAKEMPNPINPIAGQSVLTWLRDELAKAEYRATEPGAEDWGWYIDVSGAGATYLVGASAEVEGSSVPTIDWLIQVHKHRSLKEKLLGRNAMAVNDPLTTLLERIVRADPAIANVAVDRGV